MADGDGRRRSGRRPRARRRSGSRSREPSPHLAGQHYVVRLTAPDGYTASRSYSVASRARRLERDRAHRRAARRRRGLDVPARRGRGRRRARGARADRRLVRVEGRHARAARRRRLGRRAAHGDAAPRAPNRARRPRAPRRVGAHARRPVLRGRAPGTRDDDRLHARRAARRSPGRRAASRADDLASCVAPDHTALRVRLVGLRRCREPPPRRPRLPVDRIRVERFGPTG